jgi:hypothetical protein
LKRTPHFRRRTGVDNITLFAWLEGHLRKKEAFAGSCEVGQYSRRKAISILADPDQVIGLTEEW